MSKRILAVAARYSVDPIRLALMAGRSVEWLTVQVDCQLMWGDAAGARLAFAALEVRG